MSCSEDAVNSVGYTAIEEDSNLKNVEANCTRRNIDIRVKTRRFELDDRWHVWIIRREVYRDLKRHPAIILFNSETRNRLKKAHAHGSPRALYCAYPFEEVGIRFWECRLD